ncbi:MAG: ECF transporter S component [Candidatus Bathyarchaeales archaeon]
MGANSKKASIAVQLSLSAVMAALVCVATLVIRIPNPMGGYFNVGDVMIFVGALTFGPFVGGIAGGVGSALADFFGFPQFVFFTLIIKGFEGLVAGLITNKKSVLRDGVAVASGGIVMIFGYFITEIYLWGIGGALAEVPGNIGQILVGGIGGISIALVLRRRLPEIMK